MNDDTEDSSKSKIIPTECKICGAPALYKYFGATACHACKIFFKRNAHKSLESIQCDLNGQCEINLDNRHICTFCRLKKCFTSGMQIELIRCSRHHNTRKTLTTTQTTNLSQTLQISNLLDSSKYPELTRDEHDALRKLKQCYDEHRIFNHFQEFTHKQNSLPIKLRLKIPSVESLFQSIFNGIEFFFKLSNRSSEYVLRYAMENAGCLTLAFVQHEIPHFPPINRTDSILFNFIEYLPNEIIDDQTFLQLGIVLFVFSINDYTKIDRNCSQEILRIQHFYTEIIWKYLLSKYNFNQTVIFVLHLIKSLMMINHVIRDIHQSDEHQRLRENLLRIIDQQLQQH